MKPKLFGRHFLINSYLYFKSIFGYSIFRFNHELPCTELDEVSKGGVLLSEFQANELKGPESHELVHHCIHQHCDCRHLILLIVVSADIEVLRNFTL